MTIDEDDESSIKFNSILDIVNDKLKTSDKKFNTQQHDRESRLTITKMFLSWFFMLIGFSFIFSAFYNFMAALINTNPNLQDKIQMLDVANTVSIITTTLSSGVGFVIGYYFKNKDDS